MKYTIFESMHVFNMHAIYFRVYVQRLGGNITILWENPFVALLSISYISIVRKKIIPNTYINNNKENKSKYCQHETDNKKKLF